MQAPNEKPTDQSASLSMMRTLGALGYMSFFSAFLILLFGEVSAYAELAAKGNPLLLAMPAAFFVGAVTQAAMIKFRVKPFEKLAFTPCATIVSVLLALPFPILHALTAAAPALSPLAAAAALACGASTMSFFSAWDDLIGRIHIKTFSRTLSTAVFCGNALFLLIMPVSTPAHLCAVICALLVASGVLLVYLDRIAQQEQPACEGSSPQAGTSSLDARIKILFFTFNMAFGIATGLLLLMAPNKFYLTFVMTMLVLLCLIVVIHKDPSIHDRYAPVLLRLCAAIISICFLLAAFAPEETGSAFLMLLSATWQLFWIIDMGLLMNHSDKHGFSIPEHMAASRILNNSGFLLGIAATLAMALALPLANATRALAVLVVIAVIALTMALLPAESRRSPDNADKETSAAEASAPAPKAPTPEDMHLACTELARTYQLSPREREILPYLVKGRNAKHISGELFISEYTAKTHIYNIYKKLDVHSRDELLNLYDTVEMERERGGGS